VFGKGREYDLLKRAINTLYPLNTLLLFIDFSLNLFNKSGKNPNGEKMVLRKQYLINREHKRRPDCRMKR
jgi:hypothetical protein